MHAHTLRSGVMTVSPQHARELNVWLRFKPCASLWDVCVSRSETQKLAGAKGNAHQQSTPKYPPGQHQIVEARSIKDRVFSIELHQPPSDIVETHLLTRELFLRRLLARKPLVSAVGNVEAIKFFPTILVISHNIKFRTGKIEPTRIVCPIS